jgi:cell wall-associated NlpC family hydrolase
VLDGRKKNHARKAAALTAALTTVGLGLANASPAAAAPTNDLDSAQARVDRLAGQAAAADRRHDAAADKLSEARKRLDRLRAQIKRHHRIVDTARAEVASTVVEQYDGTAGAAAPSRPLSRDSEAMLTNVTVVSEDTDGRAEAISRSSERVQQLSERRTGVRERLAKLAKREQALRQQEQRLDSQVAEAGAVLADLEEKAEAKRIAAAGGPAVAYAKAQVGKSYVYGAAGPDSFDCSGLTMMAWQQAGVSLPHSSSAQYAAGQKISESELKPGDLVFYYSPISHVGIYIGNGQIANALNPGSGVQISGLHDMPYSGAVRVG